MGLDIHAYVAYKSRDEWKSVPIYKLHSEHMELVDTFPGRHTEFFEWLMGNRNDCGYGDMPFEYTNRGFPYRSPYDVPVGIADTYHTLWEGNCYGASWMTFGEMMNLYKSMPKKIKWEDEDGKVVKERNEIRDSFGTWLHTIETVTNLANLWINTLGDNIRVYYWFDN